MTFGEKIKAARKYKGYTQKQLADMVGAKHNSISDWEKDKNKPDASCIEILCSTLDITPNYLFGFSDDLFSLDDVDFARKYRKLDIYGKEVIDLLINKEYQRCISQAESHKE
ncbi:MAG: helix-turn-helix domain-containing protein [Lachnospiraceae bacterium]|nr:helix-turn-helix domain-containing protein [Lachnospiraceae bacterium]